MTRCSLLTNVQNQPNHSLKSGFPILDTKINSLLLYLVFVDLNVVSITECLENTIVAV